MRMRMGMARWESGIFWKIQYLRYFYIQPDLWSSMPTLLGNAARAVKDTFGNTDIGTMTVGNGDHDENYDQGSNGEHGDPVDPDMQEDQEHNDHGQAHVEDDPDTISEAEGMAHDHCYFRVGAWRSWIDNDDNDGSMVIEERVFKFYCDPPCPSGFNKKSNLDRHKDGTGCYHKRPYVCGDCNKRFRDKDLGGHKQGGRCVK